MMSSAAVLLKTSRASRKRFRARAKTVRLPVGIAVRLQPGIPFVFTPKSFSRSPRNPFRLAPESAPNDVNLESAFRVAIYENLLHELANKKHFKQVLRSGDRNATSLSDLLILKTTVQNYTPGSETRRAVPTLIGATKRKLG